MKRTIIKIDESKCNGCGDCVSGCHEGALQMIDGKAKLVAELYCDGLGACIGECPEGAITLEEREAVPYDEYATMKNLASGGEKVILAHIKHLKDHNEKEYIRQAVDYLDKNGINIDLRSVLAKNGNGNGHHSGGGCPGSRAVTFEACAVPEVNEDKIDGTSQLTHWPVQLHLVNPMAPYFIGKDVVLASDCSAFSAGNFHDKFLKGKSLAIACPKLDSNKDIYIEKLTAMFDEAKINTLTVIIMEVPCCGGLLQMAKMAAQNANRKVPVKVIVLSIRGEVLEEEWA